MAFIAHGAQACAQLDRSFACFERHRHVQAVAQRFRHQLLWAETSRGERLHRVDARTGRVIADLGPRGAGLERLHERHGLQRADALNELAARAADLKQAEAQNIAAGVARVPPLALARLDAWP